MFSDLHAQIYQDLPLKTAGIIFGAGLLAAHLAALVLKNKLIPLLREFPRDRTSGFVLLAICGAWSFFLISTMDLGEFYTIEKLVKFAIPVGFFLVAYYVGEFLAVRALGVLMMLVAAPFLNAAFLEPPISRLLIPAMCFVWIIVGMFWIGMPYLLRDWIGWITSEGTKRWQIGCEIGAAYGLLTLVCALLFY